MTPIEAAIKGSNNEIFCGNFYFYHAGSSIPTGYISKFVGLGIWCRNGAAVLILLYNIDKC
jgi:hypothetical protein